MRTPSAHTHEVVCRVRCVYETDLEPPQATPTIAPFSAIAVEAQGYPDAPNQPEFPSILLRKDDTLTQITRFKLSLP